MWFDPDRYKAPRAPRYKPDYPTLRAFIAFARSKPPAERYEYCDAGQCACAQFFGRGSAWGYLHYETIDAEGVDLDALARGGEDWWEPNSWTWGELADRAERELAILQAGRRAFAEIAR